MHKNPSDTEILDLLSNAKTIAVVGASANPERSSNGVMRRLQMHGYHVIPVNPQETEVLGEKSYASLADVPYEIDIVDVFRREEFTPEIARAAVEAGAKALWLQLGVVNDEAAQIAREGGMKPLMDLCIAVELTRLRVPRRTKSS